LAGEDGAHAAWLLAQHADRYPVFQRRCLELMEKAAAAGEAAKADLAHLTDRVLLASGKLQRYGTQMTARDGKYMPCRLTEPEKVNTRRMAVGLEPLEDQLARAAALYGPPRPARMPCPRCGVECEIWLPEMGGASSARCVSCGYVIRIRARVPRGVALNGRAQEANSITRAR
jgi:hypothetical protein